MCNADNDIVNSNGEPWNVGVRGCQVRPLINADAQTIRVEAGPGTGKTFGLVRRVERIVHPHGLAADGRKVLVVAFNRVIAKQLEQDIRARLILSEGITNFPVIKTIHALCLQIIGEELRLLLLHERESMIYDVLHEFPNLKHRYEDFYSAEQALKDHEAGHADQAELWQATQRWLERHKAHLIGDVTRLLLDRMKGGDFPDCKYDYVIVDEFQDLTPGEQKLMFRLLSNDGQLVALGDPRQSIYKFRGNDPKGLAKLNALVLTDNTKDVLDIPMTECHRCPVAIVNMANRLMSLSEAHTMSAISHVAANIHVVTWPNPHVEARGMAKKIADNFATHRTDRHLVMVTRRQFGYWFRDRISEIDPSLSVELSFSESLLETWPVREAFLFFCLMVDPDPPIWRSWFAYNNSETGKDYKAPKRNADAYLQLLSTANNQISNATVEGLLAERREKRRGTGGKTIWDRAKRYSELRNELSVAKEVAPEKYLELVFESDRWISEEHYEELQPARIDMGNLLEKAKGILAENNADMTTIERLRMVAQGLRHHIATREPFSTSGTPDIQVATLWGAKGITAEHVYLVGACHEAIPGRRRDEYPGTDEEFLEEQRRLFYVSITRSKRTLVISRATRITRGEAKQIGLAIKAGKSHLQMSRFLRDIIRQLPPAVDGEQWSGC